MNWRNPVEEPIMIWGWMLEDFEVVNVDLLFGLPLGLNSSHAITIVILVY